MRKLIIFIIAIPAALFIGVCYLLIFTVIIPNQTYDDKFVERLKHDFKDDISKVYVNNGRSIKINLYDTEKSDRENLRLFNAIFDYIIKHHEELIRLEDINFAFLPVNARYYAPDYRFFRGYRVEEKKTNAWKFEKINRRR